MVSVLKIDVDWVPRPDNKDPRTWREAVEWITERMEMYKLFLEKKGYHIIRITWAWTSRGVHYYIVLEEDLPPQEQLKLQWVLGDDPTRCEINYRRLQRGEFPEKNILFETVKWRRPPSPVCAKCKLWRWYMEEVKGSQPPRYAIVFYIGDEEYIETILAMEQIALKDPSFTWRVETTNTRGVHRLIIYAKDKDHAYKRGLWVKDKVFGNKKKFIILSLSG